MTTSTPATSVLATSQPEPGRKASTRVMRTRDQWKALLEEFADSRLQPISLLQDTPNSHHVASTGGNKFWPISLAGTLILSM